MAKYWDKTIRGRWEQDASGSAWRLYKTPTYHLPTGYAPVITSTACFKRDGSEIGRKFERRFWFIDIYGSSPSDHTFAADFFPLLDPVYYPEPITDANGGWKYKPLDPYLPATVTDTTIPFGFWSDMSLKIYENQNNRPEAQITGITFDTRWDTFYLSTYGNNSGDAYVVDYTNPKPPRYTYYYVAFRLGWGANWITYGQYSGNVGNNALRITGEIPDQIQYGEHTALELIKNGLASVTTSSFYLIDEGYSHYSLS